MPGTPYFSPRLILAGAAMFGMLLALGIHILGQRFGLDLGDIWSASGTGIIPVTAAIAWWLLASVAFISWYLTASLLFSVRLELDRFVFIASNLLGPCDQRAVAGLLIMLGGLRRGDERGIEHFLVGHLARHLVGFLDDAVDRRAGDSLCLDTVHLEHLLQPRHMTLGFFQMRQEALLELRIGGLVGQLRNGLHELFLGVINVLKLMHEQIVECLDVLAEQSHRRLLRLTPAAVPERRRRDCELFAQRQPQQQVSGGTRFFIRTCHFVVWA